MSGATTSAPEIPGQSTPQVADVTTNSPVLKRSWWADGAAVAAGGTLIALHGSLLGRWVVDDAAITFAYARSIDEGLGPVQQAGAAPVEGYSNPAWLGLLVIGRRLGLFDHRAVLGVPDLILFPKALGMLCALGVLIAIACAARRLVTRSWLVTAGAGVLLGANISFVAWMFSGLENPLYACVATVLAATLVRAVTTGNLLGRGPAVASGLLALVAALTRPDGAVLAGVYPLLLLLTLRRGQLWPRARAAGLGTAAFAVPYALFIAWRHLVFGRLVPNTAVAKAQELPDAELFGRTTGELLTFAGWPLVLVAAALIAVALTRHGMPRAAIGAVVLPLALTLCAFGVLEPDWMGVYRFATPVWPLGALALGLAAVGLAERGGPRPRILIAVALSGTLLLSWSAQSERAAAFRAEPTLPMCLVVNRDGVMFNEYADRLGTRDASVLLPSLGGTLLTSDLKVYDLAGLTEPRIADALAAGDAERLRTYAFKELRPTFVHAVGVWARKSGMKAPRLTAEGYLPLYRTADGGGDWVRADAVAHPERLGPLRAWAAKAVPDAYENGRERCPTHH
ncbi:hypothetical protein [Streptomyces kanamyceticus]|uniref:Glycosyltransferase RgtA/B/C/D-like domain-containing protein n=1 Tax=Streptomyces kanamyceticus TaxID=1967 RepID=A0A5J6GJA1_STRKN|nr:hypothetical protein [Streptomyces kanamyceticus]QEU94025.1 hypothetical protein CP970_26775 [Streptomyces kanamyceticus]